MAFANAVYYRPNKDSAQTPASINVDLITHIYYTAAQVDTDGAVHLKDKEYNVETEVDGRKGCIKACQALKAQNPRLKIILSVGSDQGSRHFSRATFLGYAREKFVETARLLVDSLKFDGLDVDWEHPASAKDGANYVDLLNRLRHRFPISQYMLTAVFPAIEDDLGHIDVQAASALVDYMNVMCYDFSGPWSPNSGYQAQLYTPRQAYTPFMLYSPPCAHLGIVHLRNKNVPMEKILFGIPTYVRRFSGVARVGQEYHRNNKDLATFPYKNLPKSAYLEIDEAAVAAYCVQKDITDGILRFYTCDNPLTVMMKADYVKQHRLGGLFYSNVFEDTDDSMSLINAGYNAFNA